MRLESGEMWGKESARKLISNKQKTTKNSKPKRKNDKAVNKYLH